MGVQRSGSWVRNSSIGHNNHLYPKLPQTMRILNILLLAGCALLLLMYTADRFKASTETNEGTINAILGDESYISTFGEAPDSGVTDAERIFTHLTYVEELLRNSLSDNITPEQRDQRLAFLDHLRDYRMAGNFPVNDNHPDIRRPTFISDNGNICAVGYLVEQSAGRAMAEHINDHYKYSYIKAIDAPEFLDWAAESGFTVEELAMIQPAYQSTEEVRVNNNRLGAPYVVVSGVALTANALYWSQDVTGYTPFPNDNARQWAGLAIGAGTMLYGSFNVNATSRSQVNHQNGMWNTTINYVETNHLRTGISAGHIAVGAATVIRSAWYLLSSSPQPGPSDSGLVVTSYELPQVSGTQAVSGIGYRFSLN